MHRICIKSKATATLHPQSQDAVQSMVVCDVTSLRIRHLCLDHGQHGHSGDEGEGQVGFCGFDWLVSHMLLMLLLLFIVWRSRWEVFTWTGYSQHDLHDCLCGRVRSQALRLPLQGNDLLPLPPDPRLPLQYLYLSPKSILSHILLVFCTPTPPSLPVSTLSISKIVFILFYVFARFLIYKCIVFIWICKVLSRKTFHVLTL